jgi:hypothetical protein
MEERRPFVEYLERHIPGLTVVWDEGRGAWETWRRSWLTCPPGESTVFLQDDICLTRNFTAKIRGAILQYPNTPINFFSSYKERGLKTDAFEGRHWYQNLAYYLPAGLPLKLYNFTYERGTPKDGGGQDRIMNQYFRSQKIAWILWHPNLVDHAGVPSTLGNDHYGPRRSLTFEEPELEGFPEPDLILKAMKRREKWNSLQALS